MNQKKIIVVKRKNAPTATNILPINQSIDDNRSNNFNKNQGITNERKDENRGNGFNNNFEEDMKMKKEMNKEIKRELVKKADNINRVMMRGIPPHITEETFKKQIEKYISKSDSNYYVQGINNSLKFKNSRAYINFPVKTDAEEFIRVTSTLSLFNEEDEKENKEKSTPSIQISFAPLQRIPPAEIKQDELENTIENDPEYLSFLEESQKQIENKVSMEDILKERSKVLEQKKEIENKVTPLVKHIIAEREKRKEKENEKQKKEKREMEKERRSIMRKERTILKKSDLNRSNNHNDQQPTSTKEVIVKGGKKIITIKKNHI
eukprot:TRINITY_DN6241_c0_g1_i1.p1 TRINITY_DN6241_c0_g1~~TRINITY_DN6241_c0_g1_i1.p1  ORF type:complete len:321 (+),score=129.66 TRINITY_DN6241_c0_g1_i1:1-963(+)